jgi:uncharacterized protein YjbI with pentapeptide repeats
MQHNCAATGRPLPTFPAIGIAIGLAASILFSLGAIAEETEPVNQHGADFTVREISSALYKAKPGEKLNYSNHNLTYLDLAGLNFKGANLAHSDLYGVDLTGANLRGTDLSHTRLDRSVLIRADLSGANLSGATILRPTIYADLSADLADAPRFAGADLSGIRVMANMSGSDFHGADMTGANLSPLEARPGQGTITTLAKNMLKSCDFSRAILRGVNFDRAVMTFSRFVGADLRDANLTKADLSKADLTGADLTGADLSGADLDGANLVGVKGLDTVKGLATAVNFDKTIR